jgi:hypothetical protein
MTTDTTPATKGDLNELKEEIFHYFDLTVETIRHDLEGANHDQIELLKDARLDHERRLLQLERSVGFRAR